MGYAELVGVLFMSENSTDQKSRSHLAYLRLTAAAERSPKRSNSHQHKLGHSAFLEQLLNVEVAATERRRKQRLERFACLPSP
ncbi:MAG: hypothetical protein ACLPVY_17240 [Acidimicrobiia bacterium]